METVDSRPFCATMAMMDHKLPTPAPHEIEKTGDDSPAASLYGYVWRMSGWHQVWVSLIAAAAAALAFAPLELQRRVVDDAIGGESARLLLTLGVIFLGIILVQGALKFALRIYQGWLSESAIRYTREHLSKIYACRIATEGDHFGTPRGAGTHASGTAEDDDDEDEDEAVGRANASESGRAVSIIGAEVDKLGGFVGEAFVAPVVNLGAVFAIFGYMLIVETGIALVSMIFLVPQLLLTPWVQRRINVLTEERVDLMRELGDIVASEPEESSLPDGEGFQRNLTSVFANRMRISIWKFLLKGLINLSSHLATLCVLVFGGWLVIESETTVGVIVAFVTGFERVADPMRRVLNFYRTAQIAAVQHRMIAQIL